MSNTPNTDTLEDQAREYFKTDSGPFTKDVADFARQVAKEAVRRREVEVMQKLTEICKGDVWIRTDLRILIDQMKAGSE